MSHLNPGLISAYNSLTDKHLAGYFSNTRIRRHLQRAGLITRSGRIVPDKEYRRKLIQRQHQRHVRECLAQAIFHKVLEIERVHQIEIKRRLEEFARRERVHKIKKVECSKRYEEDLVRVLSPHPPTGARGFRKQHSGPEGEHSESSESPGSSRPNTAPGKMQRPVRLKPIHSNVTTASLRRSSPYRPLESSNENHQQLDCTMEPRSRLSRLEASHGTSPYCLPVINNFVTPVPPATKKKERAVKVTPCCTLRGRRLRPTTSFGGSDDPLMLRSSVQSRVSVTMIYFGKTVHLSHDLNNMRDEVKVFQQHCGGENLCVYKGLICEGDTFQFISRRHRGFPFSLTLFLNGLQVERLSSCCEFKHRKGSRLGGRHGHFGFSSIEGASPCYKCIIAMGLDKKPTPPPKRVKEDRTREELVISRKDSPEMKTKMNEEDAASNSDCETGQPHDMETQVEEDNAAKEEKVRDEYEEDFEADDDGPLDAAVKEKKSPSSFSENQDQVKERDAFETEDEEKDEDIKSCSSSSSSGSNPEDSDAEADKDSREDEKTEQPKDADREETVVPPDGTDEPNPDEAAATEAESAVTKDSDVHNSAAESAEMDLPDSSVPSGNENRQSDNASGDNEVDKTVDESKQEDEVERAKSVQEKLVEAILKDSQCSSEPELSDTSTDDEEEESAQKDLEQDNKEKAVTCREHQQNLTEETNCKESVAPEDKVVAPDGEALSDPKEQEDGTEPKPHEDGYNDERVERDPASEENTVETNKSEDTSLCPVHGEEMDDKILELQEEAGAAKSTDAAGKDEEKTAVEADTQLGQGAKNNKERESSVSEPIEQAEENAVPDNAEALTPTETMEMKAEPSEEQEALSCEEAPVSDTEKRQQGDSKGRAAASETEDTAENSSSSPEGRGDATIENRAEASGNNANDESNKDDIKKGEAEEVSAGETRKENLREMHELEEGQTERSVEKEKVEEKCDKDVKEQEDQTNPDEIAESVTTEERAVGNNKIKTETRVENEVISELTKSDSNMEGKKYEKAENNHNEEAAIEEKADEWEKTEKDEDCERVRNENDEEEKEASADTTNEVEKMSATNKAAGEEKNNEAEKEEKAGQSEAAKNGDEEKKVETDETAEGEEILETEEPKKSTNVELSDNAKMLDENVVESNSVVDCEAASAACETVMTEEMQTNGMEVKDEKKETKRGSNNENGEIDAENGEISSGVENKSHKNEGEAQSKAKRDVKTEERIEERKTDDPIGDESIEVNEVTVVGDDKTDQALVTESEVNKGNDSGEIHEGFTKNNWEPATSRTESPSDDGKDCEDESCNISDPDHENRDLDLMRKDDRVTSPGDQGQSSTPIAVDLNDTAHECENSTELYKTDKHPHTDTAATYLSAIKGENGDPEEASKASEEGASVLLKPAAQSLSITLKEESIAVGGDIPESLAKEDHTDLVSNWVTTHQASRFFETFVEPLDDLKESDAQVTHSTRSTELLRSVSPLKMLTPRDVNDSRDKTREESIQLEPESNQFKDGELCKEDPVRDILQVQETEVTDLIPEAETEQNDKESVEGHDVPEEDKGQEGKQDNTEQTAISKTEVESIAGTCHSVTSGRPESVSENQTEQKTADPDQNKKQTGAAEMNDLLPSSETEECCEFSASPEWLSKVKKNEPEETWEKGGEFTEITALREDGNQEEWCRNEAQPKPSDESINGDGRDVRLTENIQHPLSKDQLSPFSVDKTLFGPSSYPLLTVARTESGH